MSRGTPIRSVADLPVRGVYMRADTVSHRFVRIVHKPPFIYLKWFRTEEEANKGSDWDVQGGSELIESAWYMSDEAMFNQALETWDFWLLRDDIEEVSV
jgi:hypothetical protein